MKKIALIALAALATAHAYPTRTATEGYVDRTVAAATNGLATAADLAGHVPARASSVGTADTWTDATGVVWRVVREYGPWTHSADGEADITYWFWGEDPNGEIGWVGGASVEGALGMPAVRSKDPDAVSVAWGEGHVSILSTRGVSATTVAVDRVSYESGIDATLTNLAGAVDAKADKASVYTTSEVDAKVAAVGSKADEAYSAAEQMVDAVNSLSGTIGTHTRDTNNPHKVTAAQVGALPIIGGTLTGDLAVGEAFAGSRTLFIASDAVANGITLQGGTSSGEGSYVSIGGSSNKGATLEVNGGGFGGGTVMVGASAEYGGGAGGKIEVRGTDASIKKDGKEVATESYVDAKVENAVLPTNPTFSNAVLSVGLNIDTDSVAVLNEIASTFGGFPIEGTATTVGGLLAALAAAVAWLRKNKADKATSSASAALLSDNAVALVDGSAGGETAVSFKAPSGNALRYCELMLTGVASDGAVTLVLPAGTYQFADGADSVPKGNSHFCFAEYARGKWLVTRQSTTEKAVEEVGA